MELRQLRYFAAVAQRRHFTAAAEVIGVAQPALSQQIRLLERELGLELFDRTGRRVRLTPAGAALLVRAERVLAEVEDAASEMAEYAGLLRGRLVVGALPSLAGRLMPALLADFRARHPGLELTMREASTGQLLTLVEAGEIDLALVHRPTTDLSPRITLEPLFSEELVAAVAPGHPLAALEPLPIERLQGEPLLLSLPGSGLRQATLAACTAAGVTPRVAFESGGVTTLRALAAAGLGVAIMPRSEAEAIGPPVITRSLAPILSRLVALAWPANRFRPAAMHAFLTLTRSYVHSQHASHPPKH